MNLNKNFLTEVIKYLISRGVTVHDVLDTFNEQFEYHEQNISRHDEVRKPITDIDLLLCGREIEKQGFNVEPEPKENPAPLKVSLSPNKRNYPTSTEPRGRGMSKARKMLFEVVEGKTVLEHLKANNINYKLFDTRIRKNWTMEKACTTPMTRVIRPYTKSKKPEETLETKTETLETESNTEKAAESVTIEPQIKTDTDTRVNDADMNSDAKNSESERIEQLADKTVRDIVTGKNKEKKKPENKKDYTTADICFKLNVTTHELKEMISTGEFPQPDCGNKWSAKLLKGII